MPRGGSAPAAPQLGGGRPAGRQVGAHGQALHPACRGGGERHPGLHTGEGRKVNRFCTVLENGSADLETFVAPGRKPYKKQRRGRGGTGRRKGLKIRRAL